MPAVPNARPEPADSTAAENTPGPVPPVIRGTGSQGADLASVAMLGDPARRALYAYIASQDRPVSRDDAADATGMKRSTAAFHLDRMVEEGLLEAAFARVSGRTGPGAGRTAKLYRRACRQIGVSLPPRRYEIAGDILARAVEEALRSPVALSDAVARAAEQTGRQLAALEDSQPSGEHRLGDSSPGQAGAGRASPPSARETPAAEDRLADLLVQAGYEPRTSAAGTVQLANCPFHELALRHTRLVCEMNRHLLQGVIDELGLPARATLDPSQRGCCVVISADADPDT